MKIQGRVFLLIFTICGLFAGWLAIQMHEDKHRLDVLTEEMSVHESAEFDTALEMKGAKLKSFADDYSYWDEMVRFIKEKNTKWAYQNILTGLNTFNLDAAWVLDPAYESMYSQFSKRAGGIEIDLDKDVYRTVFTKSLFPHYFVMTKAGLLELRGAPVQPVSDVDRKSTPRGYLLGGRLWGKEDISELSFLTGCSIKVLSTNAAIPSHGGNNEIIHFIKDLPGWDGKPVARIHLDTSPPYYKSIIHTLEQQLTFFVIFTASILCILTFSMVMWVSRPLAAISRTLDRQDPRLLGTLEKNPAEFGRIASLIKRSFEQKAELEQTQAAVREEKNKLENILSNIADCITIQDKDYNVIYQNRAMKDTFGDCVGKRCYRAYENRNDICDDCPVMKSFEDGGVHSIERKTGRLGGTEYLDIKASPLRDLSGSIIAGVESVRVVTDRRRAEESLRQSEEMFRNVFENAKDVIYTVSKDKTFTSLNPAFESMTGWKKEEWLGKPFAPMLHPSDLPKVNEVFQSLMSGEEVETFEMRIRNKSGDYITAESTVSPINLDGGGAVLGIVRNVTERKRMEEEIRKLNLGLETKVLERTRQLLDAQEELVRKEKLATLGQVAGVVGHELRNPLGVMNNAVYFLQAMLTDADDTTREYLGIIKDEISGAERIVSDLLDSVRTKPPRPEKVMVRDIVSMSTGKCAIPGNVELHTVYPETLLALSIDPLQIKQVFINLINNAVDAMPNGGTLDIKAEEDKGRSEIRVSVRDTGMGIAPENMEKLFQPLYTTKARGIGLGLAVVKNLTEANGGRVEVESTQGAGTSFTVILPVMGGAS